jgi:segregation and condensation protein A
MSLFEVPKVSLDTFEGPLDLLLHLVQKSEVNIFDITLKKVTEQFTSILKEIKDDNVDFGSEFLSLMSSLLLLKSNRLLPESPIEDENNDPSSLRNDILEHLIEYCQFKELALKLKNREQHNKTFPRGISSPPPLAHIPKKSGLEQLTLFDLAEYLKETLAKAQSTPPVIKDETWKISDKINEIKQHFQSSQLLPLKLLFNIKKSKIELIVTFLSILELLKQGECAIFKQNNTLFLSGYQNESRN